MKAIRRPLVLILDNKALLKFILLIFVTEFVRGAYISYIPFRFTVEMVDTVGGGLCALFLIETLSKTSIGWLLDRFNNRVILMSGLTLSMISLLALNFIESPVLFILDGAMFGLGFAPVWLIVLGYVTKFDDSKRALSMGVIYSTWLAGLGLGSVVTDFLIFRSDKMALNTIAILWVVALIIGIFIKESIREKQVKIKNSTFKKYIKRFSSAKLLIPGMVLQTFSLSILLAIVPKYITDKRFAGLSTDQYGITLGLVGAITVISMTIFGKMANRFKPENLFVFGLFFTAVGIFGIGSTLSMTMIIIFAIIIGLAYSAVLPSWNTIMSNNIDKDNIGLMWGGFSTIEGVGRALGPLVGGLLGKYFSLQFSFYFSGIIILGLAILYFYLNKQKKLRQQQ